MQCLCFVSFINLQHVKNSGYAVCDIVTELSKKVMLVDLPDPGSNSMFVHLYCQMYTDTISAHFYLVVMSHIIDKLSTVEFRLSHGVAEKVQIGALVGSFTVARNMMQ